MERAIQEKLIGQEDAARAQTKLETAQANLAVAATALAKAGKTVEEEFEASFFQGYADLKRRVAVDHPKWDLATYSGANSNFWEVESPAA